MNAIAARRAGKSLRLTLPHRHPAVFVVTCGYLGHLPVVGKSTHLGSLSVSLITPFIFWPIIQFYGITMALLVLAIANFLGTWALMSIEKLNQPANHDSRAVVIDEFVGAGLASLMLPIMWQQMSEPHLGLMAAAALLVGLIFRILDITKVFPASTVDLHWHDAYAVIADDVVAGLQTVLVLLAFCLIF